MRFQWRRLRPGELDAELIWLCVTVATAATGAIWFALRLPVPQCTFRALTDLPCVTCGATRAAMALLQGDLFAAWRSNPLVFVAIAAVLIFDLYALAVLLARARRLRVAFPARRMRAALAAIGSAAVLLNWIYLLRR